MRPSWSYSGCGKSVLPPTDGSGRHGLPDRRSHAYADRATGPSPWSNRSEEPIVAFRRGVPSGNRRRPLHPDGVGPAGAGVVGGCVVGGAVVGGAVDWVVAGRVVAGRLVTGRVVTGRRVVVLAPLRSLVVVVRRRPEAPRKAPDPGEPPRMTVVEVGCRGPLLEGAPDCTEAIVGAGESPVPRGSQPGPQRPPAARAKATAKATTARAANPATRTWRRVRQPSARATSSLWARSTSGSPRPAATTGAGGPDGFRAEGPSPAAASARGGA